MACVAAACGEAQTTPVAVGTERPSSFDNDRLPSLPAMTPAKQRLVRYRPDIAVVGRGAFADGLVDGRAHADLPEGWRAEVRVAPDCASGDCLHWIAWSADGTRRIERLPADASPGGDAAQRRERAARRLDRIRARMFPDARDVAMHDPRAGCGRDADDGVAVALQGFTRDIAGKRRDAYLMVEVPGDAGAGAEAAVDAASACRSSGGIETMPEGADLLAGMRQVAQSFRVLPEGWDASRAACEYRIQVLCTEQSLQSARDCGHATCERTAGFWELRIDDDGNGRARLRPR